MPIIYDPTILKKINYEQPKEKDVFNALDMDAIKVVIIGEEPYPNDNAHGYAFSSQGSITPSLKNIFKAVGYTGDNGNLQSWVDQGVMLLNAYLTWPDKPKAWNPFNRDVVTQVCQKFPKCCFLLWGKEAQKFEEVIIPFGNKIFTSPHGPQESFDDNSLIDLQKVSSNFKACNAYLEEAYTIKTKGKTLQCILSPKIIWDPDCQRQKQVVVAFTDGSFKGSNSKAAWAVYFPEQIYGITNAINGYRRAPIVGTNIDAEGMAIFKAFDVFKFLTKYYYADFKFILVTDSEFWIRCITGLNKVNAKRELFDKIMKVHPSQVDLIFIPSHKKPVKSLVPYKNFNGTGLTDEQAEDLIFELRAGNKEVDELAGELTL